MFRHLDALIERLGENGVALGSAFNGARIPSAIGDASGLPRLLTAMRQRGYGPSLIRKIAHGNWLSLLERTWKGRVPVGVVRTPGVEPGRELPP